MRNFCAVSCIFNSSHIATIIMLASHVAARITMSALFYMYVCIWNIFVARGRERNGSRYTLYCGKDIIVSTVKTGYTNERTILIE